MRAIRISEYGGPEVLRVEPFEPPKPGAGQILVRLDAAGVNFIDLYHRTGYYQVALPYGMGLEGAGAVEAVGDGVTEFKEGDRVAWMNAPGSYADHVLLGAERAVPVPAGVEPQVAAAVMLQGITAHYLSQSTYALKPGDTCLVHAAAGGTGLLLTQMAKRRGARVIATVSSEAKAALAREAGADEVILYTRDDFTKEARRLTGGRGVQVAYDSVGKDTYLGSLDSLCLRGMLVLFGQSSGGVPPFDPRLLSTKGSLFLTRPLAFDYVATREELLSRSADVLGSVARGELHVRIGATFPLAEAAEAHRQLEARKTTGKVLLLP